MKQQTLTKYIILGWIFFSISYSYARTGKEIFNNTCVSCHSTQPSRNDVPILLGQEPAYTIDALKQFVSGERTDNILGVMKGMAESLSPEERKSVSKYLAGRDICEVSQSFDTEDQEFLKSFRAGAQIVDKMNCMHCHSSFHHGAPKLFGQKKEYIKVSLEAFKSGKRENPMMQNFASRLSQDDIEKVATYLNGMILMRQCQ